MDKVKEKSTQTKYLTGVSVWAMAFGCVIGWGSFVMPGTTFLPDAGPVGTIIGVLVAAVMAYAVCENYSWMVQQFPQSRGSYVYTRNILGEDHAFLAAWSLELAYVSLLWANATALGLMARYLFMDTLQWGIHYRVAGYDVYLGEVLAVIAAELVFGLITTYARRLADILRIIFAVTLFLSVIVLFIGIVKNLGCQGMFSPAFSSGEPVGIQIIDVAVFAPFLFVGFETVTHSVGEIRFPVKRIFSYAALAAFSGMVVYILLALTGAAGTPDGYGSWTDYVNDLHSLSGIAGMPVFYNAQKAMGPWGLRLAGLAAFCALATGMLGFHRAAARVLRIMAKYRLMPRQFAETDANGVPVRASLLILFTSLPMPLLGRTALGWNADVSTLSVAIVYAYISICAIMTARKKQNRKMEYFGFAGIIFSVLDFLFLLIPNIFMENALAKESYFMLAAWSALGILYYWYLFGRDRDYRFGKSTVMWIMMLFLLFFSVNVWTRLYAQSQLEDRFGKGDGLIRSVLTASSMVQLVVIVIALLIMFSLFKTMLKRERELDYQIIQAEERNKAKTDFLSNMSHDIRTPMNAIIGFTDLALLDVQDLEKTEEYLNKIKASSAHLLSLINDVLEMSRIESGKIEIGEEIVNLPELLHDLNTIIIGQVEAKQQELFMDAVGVMDENILSDKLRLNQILLNLTSNAIKYTPAGGKISLRIIQKSSVQDGKAPYEIRVKDNGIGMSEEFAEKIFDAFEREQTSTVSGIQGTGLGMAITKSIVELMGGTIRVETAPGEGSEFIVAVDFAVREGEKKDYQIKDLKGVKALVVDDDFDTCDSATNLLIEMGLDAEWTLHGKEAVVRAKQAISRGNGYGIYLIDWKLPDLSGIEVARQLRQVSKSVPILLMTAYDWPSIREEALDAGVKGFCNKPLFASELHTALMKVVGQKEEETGEASGQEINTDSFAGKRILLVDDVMINRQIALAMLEMYGFEVEEAEDGTEAVEKVEQAEAGYYDVVLMDIQMPKMNGYDASRAIRKLADEEKARVPIFAMTANAFDEDIKNALDAGMDGHIAKPIDREKLIETLGNLLS